MITARWNSGRRAGVVGTQVARGAVRRNKHWPDVAGCCMDFGLFCFSKAQRDHERILNREVIRFVF